jgi:hypothetical protein
MSEIVTTKPVGLPSAERRGAHGRAGAREQGGPTWRAYGSDWQIWQQTA